MEEWKDIAGYEGLYQVSNLGRVKSLDRCVRRGNRTMKKQGRIMNQTRLIRKPEQGKAIYHTVLLSDSGMHKRYLVHRLVATAFISNPLQKDQVNHIDGNGENNNVSNLEWCDGKENMRHAWDTGILNSGNVTKPFIERSKRRRGKNSPTWGGYIEVIDKDGKTVTVCETLLETQTWVRNNTKFKKARLSHIGEVCQGKYKQAYGFKFRRYYK